MMKNKEAKSNKINSCLYYHILLPVGGRPLVEGTRYKVPKVE